MSYRKISALFLISLTLVLCQSSNKDKKENLEPLENMNQTNSTFNNETKMKKPFNFSIDEMDTIIFCSGIVQEYINKHRKEIEEVAKKLNLSKTSNKAYDKIGTDIFEKCNKKIDIKIVNNVLKNLSLVNNFQWKKEFDEFTKIDYDRYMNESDLELTLEQQLLMNKYRQINGIFNARRMADREKIQNENKKIRIGKIDMETIPQSFKYGLFLVIIIIFFGGIFFFLKTLVKEPLGKKKKEKKKKIQ